MLNRILDYSISISDLYSVTIGQLILLLLLLIISYLALRLTKAKWRIDFFNKNEVEAPYRRKFERYLRQLIVLVTTFFVIRLLNFDFELYNFGNSTDSDGVAIRYSAIIFFLIILVVAWIIDWYVNHILINRYEKDRATDSAGHSREQRPEIRNHITKLVQYIVIILAGLAILKNFNLDYTIFEYSIANESRTFKISIIFSVALIFLLAQVIFWVLTQVILFGFFKRKDIDQGAQFAINQLLKYIIYVIATLMAINALGINMTLVWGGAAALLVGIGLGLQQTFNDFFSGLVLLFERTVSVGDIMDVGGVVGTVKKIGLRSSIVETRANVSIIVPNSKLVNDSVKNWTHFVDYGRFEVHIGVAYGSDTILVKKLLLQSANENTDILNYPKPFVRFNNFGDSALEFTLLFFANKFLIIDDIKSDMRFKIDDLFKENNISIPFPQRDVWFRNANPKEKQEGENEI